MSRREDSITFLMLSFCMMLFMWNEMRLSVWRRNSMRLLRLSLSVPPNAKSNAAVLFAFFNGLDGLAFVSPLIVVVVCCSSYVIILQRSSIFVVALSNDSSSFGSMLSSSSTEPQPRTRARSFPVPNGSTPI